MDTYFDTGHQQICDTVRAINYDTFEMNYLITTILDNINININNSNNFHM